GERWRGAASGLIEADHVILPEPGVDPSCGLIRPIAARRFMSLAQITQLGVTRRSCTSRQVRRADRRLGAHSPEPCPSLRVTRLVASPQGPIWPAGSS